MSFTALSLTTSLLTLINTITTPTMTTIQMRFTLVILVIQHFNPTSLRSLRSTPITTIPSLRFWSLQPENSMFSSFSRSLRIAQDVRMVRIISLTAANSILLSGNMVAMTAMTSRRHTSAIDLHNFAK
jgi:hypothetical protein